jgi:hypothetical protein
VHIAAIADSSAAATGSTTIAVLTADNAIFIML